MLGNHDTIRMVPGLEDMGIQMLLNEISGLSVTVNAFTWPVSMARTITVWTILRRLQPEFLSGLFRSCYRTRPKSTSRRRMPISACSFVGTPMECARDGGQFAGWELTGAAGLSEDESHVQAPHP
jgi:hypothetical protein